MDAGFAAAVTVFMVMGTYGAAQNEQLPAVAVLEPLTFALIAVAGLGVLIRRLYPLTALAVTVVAGAAYLVLGYPYGPILFSVAITTYTTATRYPIGRSLPTWAAAATVLAVPFGADLDWDSPLPALARLAGWSSWSLTAWAIGTVVSTARRSAQRSRAERERQRTDEERLRTAQDVHDIVGHGLAAISMQAGVALHVLDRSPARARELLEAIRASSHHSLEELRATLAVFRATGAEDGAREPLPGLARLDSLIARVADSGLQVKVHTSGDPRPLLGSVDNAAYRIVQESLTNVLRHAGPASAVVRVGYGQEALTVEISDTGRGPGASEGTGLGLAGMRARALALGGTVSAGPGAAGGFVVHAQLPLGEPR